MTKHSNHNEVDQLGQIESQRVSRRTSILATALFCLLFVITATSPCVQAQLTITNIGSVSPSNVFLSNSLSATFTTLFEGDGGAGDASDGRGQGFITPSVTGGDAWSLSSITVQAHGSGNSDFPSDDFDFQLSIYQWPTSNLNASPSIANGDISATLLYRDVATLPSTAPLINDHFVFDLGTDVPLLENTAYSFLIEFDPASGTKDSEQLRLRVSGNSGNDFVPGNLWRSSYDISSSEYLSSTNFTSQDLAFHLSGVTQSLPSTPTLMVDRDSGNLTLDAVTFNTLNIIEYDIRTTGGGFEKSNWNSIESQGLDANDTWFTFSLPSDRTELAEGTLGELLLTGAASTIDFGNAWIPNPFEDIEMVLTLDDSTTVTTNVVYTGNGGIPFAFGDFTGTQGTPDGVIDALDWPTVRDNMLTDVSSFDLFDRYLRGDLDQNGSVDRFDFRAFKDAYESQNGVGSFAQLLAVPEPSTSLILLLGMAFVVARRPRHGVKLLVLLLLVPIFDAPLSAQVIFTETWNTTDGTAGDWTSFNSFSENRVNDMAGQEGDRGRAINNLFTTGSGYVFNNLTATQGISWQPNTRYTIDVLAGYRSPFASGALDFGVWNGVPIGPATAPSLGIEGFVKVAMGDGDPNPPVPDNTYAEVASLTDPSVVQFNFETGSSAPTGDLVLFLRNSVTEPMSGERVYADHVRLNAESLSDLVTLVVDPTNGLMQLRGASDSNHDIDFFQIESAGGHLLTNNWNSLDDQGIGDANGVPGWEIAGGSNAQIVAEQFLRGAHSAAPGAAIGGSLGSLWDSANGPIDPLTDLSFLYTTSDGTDQLGLIQIESLPTLPGDFNDDGTVDAGDFTVWRDNFGNAVTLANDPTPGSVTQADYDLWKLHFGTGNVAATIATVPEPGSAQLVIAALLLLFCRVRSTMNSDLLTKAKR